MLNDIGHKIKCIRKENNLNQVQFAKSIGISQGNLSEMEDNEEDAAKRRSGSVLFIDIVGRFA